MGTQTFHNDCNYVLTLYKYQVNCLFCFPDLLILICVPKLNAFHLLILSNSLKSLSLLNGEGLDFFKIDQLGGMFDIWKSVVKILKDNWRQREDICMYNYFQIF